MSAIEKEKRTYVDETDRDGVEPENSEICPLHHSSILSKVTLWWCNSLVRLGRSKVLEVHDVWELPPEDDVAVVCARFDQQLEDQQRRLELATASTTPATATTTPPKQALSSKSTTPAAVPKPKLLTVLIREFGVSWIWAGILHFLVAVGMVVQPIFVKFLVTFLASNDDDDDDNDEPVVEGYLWALGLMLTTVFNSACINQKFVIVTRAAAKVRTAVISAIYGHTLRLSSAARQSSSNGQMVNLMSNDAERLFQGSLLVHFLWIGPLQIVSSLILMFNEVGVAALAGTALMFLLVPIQGVMARHLGGEKRKMLQHTDERVKLMSELLQGIRVVKLYAWEVPLQEKLQRTRSQELHHLKRYLYLTAVNMTILFVVPVFVSLFTMGTYSLMGNELSVGKVFAVLAYINIMRFPIALLPLAINGVTQMLVAIRRLQTFFGLEVLPEQSYVQRGVVTTTLGHDSDEDVIIQNGTFWWNGTATTSGRDVSSSESTKNDETGENEPSDTTCDDDRSDNRNDTGPVLDKINIRIKRGELVAVVGQVGCGKSSLLSAILGEMEHSCDAMSVNATIDSNSATCNSGSSNDDDGSSSGQLAFVSQEAWILNDSVRNNILFDLPYHEQDYAAALDAAVLRPDLAMLRDGDATVIGERGINLSGGQRQRVSMARALYRRRHCRLYLLDDPFSAVDTLVGRKMFFCGILQALKGKTRVVALSSHLHLLRYFDRIIVIGNDSNGVVSGSSDVAVSDSSDRLYDSVDGDDSSRGSGSGFRLDHANVEVLERDTTHDQDTTSSDVADNNVDDESQPLKMAIPPQGSNGRSADRKRSGTRANTIVAEGKVSDLRLRFSALLNTRVGGDGNNNDKDKVLDSDDDDGSTDVVVATDGKTDEEAMRERIAWESTPLGKEPKVYSLSTSLKKGTDEVHTAVGDVIVTSDPDLLNGPNLLDNADKGKKMKEVVTDEGGGGKALYENEDRVQGAVSWRTFIYYYQSIFRRDEDEPLHHQQQKTTTSSLAPARDGESRRGGTLLCLSLLFLYTIAQSARVASDLWLAWWSDKTHFPDGDGNRFWLPWYAVTAAIALLLALIRSLIFYGLSLDAARRIQEAALASLLQAPVNLYFDVTPIGRIINRFSKDTDQVDALLPEFTGMTLQNSFILFGSLLLCIVSLPVFLAFVVPMLWAFWKIQQYFRSTSRELKRLEGITRSPMYSRFSETINGLNTIRAYGSQTTFVTRNNRLIRQNAKVYFAHHMVQRWLALRLDWLSASVVGSVSFMSVVLRDSIDAPVAALAILYSMQFTGLLQWVVRTSIETENHLTAVERMHHFFSIPKEQPAMICDTAPPTDWPQEGAIEIVAMGLRYRPDLPYVLRGISCSIGAGEKIGICGRTGAGKSSLMLALFRMVEPEVYIGDADGVVADGNGMKTAAAGGVISIDGVDIQSIGLRQLRSKLSIIPQDPVLFSGTLRYNLDPFAEASDTELWTVLERVHLRDHVVSLSSSSSSSSSSTSTATASSSSSSSKRATATTAGSVSSPPRTSSPSSLSSESGLDYLVAERGENLSLGQRQLICIGRALLRRARIIVMDEATSSISSDVDALIQQTVRENFQEQTVLTIAHRLDSILNSDRIMLLDKGMIAEFAAPQTLLKDSKSLFYGMVNGHSQA